MYSRNANFPRIGDVVKTPLPKARAGRVLADWVTNSLREAILHNYFEPGEKLDQDLIAEEFEVSRTPVREAVRRLEAEGFLEILPHRGAFITRVSQQDIHNVYEIRRLLEAEVVRQVTPVIPQDVLDDLRQSIAAAEKAFKAGNETKHAEADVHFHETIMNFVENELLKEVLDSLTNRVSMVRYFAQLQPGYHMIESFQEHLSILEAMSQRDAETAAALMTAHLEKSAQRIQEIRRA
jgi:DNA-binding GntR family transcriptional regulator